MSRFRQRNKVLLPAPEAPMMPKTWRGWIVRLTLRSSVRLPANTDRPRVSRIAASAGLEVGRQSLSMPRLLVDSQAYWQRDQAQDANQRQQHQRRTPQFRADSGVE